jgi:hypothetical protein
VAVHISPPVLSAGDFTTIDFFSLTTNISIGNTAQITLTKTERKSLRRQDFLFFQAADFQRR